MVDEGSSPGERSVGFIQIVRKRLAGMPDMADLLKGSSR
jgi:hypothetical protein